MATLRDEDLETPEIDVVLALALGRGRFIKATREWQVGLPVMLWSSSGRGKSEGLRDGFRRAGYDLVVVDTMNRPPEHLAGIALADTYLPNPENAREFAKLPAPWRHYVRSRAAQRDKENPHGLPIDASVVKAPSEEDIKRGAAPEIELVSNRDGILCFSAAPWKELLMVEAPGAALDLGDLPSAPKMVQLGCNTILLDRRFGTHHILRTPVVADGNFSSTSIQSVMPANTANRMIHLMWQGKDAMRYLEQGMMVEPSQIDLSRLETMWDDREYDGYFSKWASAVGSFIGEHDFAVIEEDPEHEAEDPSQLAFATMRSYEMMARALTSLDIFGIEAQLPVMQGCIGATMGLKFNQWLQEMRIPSLQDIYAHKVDWSNCGGPAAAVAGLHQVAMHCNNPDQVTAFFDGVEGAMEVFGAMAAVKAVRLVVQRTCVPGHPKHLNTENCEIVNVRGDPIAATLGLTN